MFNKPNCRLKKKTKLYKSNCHRHYQQSTCAIRTLTYDSQLITTPIFFII